MQTLVHLLNFTVTNYSIMPNGVIYKGLFLAREARFPRLRGESLQRLLGEAGRGGGSVQSTYSHPASPQAILAVILTFASLKKQPCLTHTLFLLLLPPSEPNHGSDPG